MENQNNTLIINIYLFNFNSEMILSLFNSIDQGLIPYKFIEECDDKESYTELQDLFNEFNLKLK